MMGWPNNYAEYAYDSNGNVVGHVIGNNTVNKYLVINDGDAIDTILNAAIADLRATATANRGRMACITIPSGNYTMSSTTATITLEPWVRLKTDGNVRIVGASHSVPFFWVRNDIDTSLTLNSAYENNNGKVIDASNGVLMIENNRTAGSCGIRVGNGDGSWGTAYAGNVNYNVAFVEFSNILVVACDSGIQITNNCAFCLRFENVRLSSNNFNIRTSPAVVNVNAMEQSSFVNCFLNDAQTANILFDGGTASTTNESGHQLSFFNCSLTYSLLDNIIVNTAAKYRAEFSACRVENGDYIVRSTVLSPKSWFVFSNTTFAPTKLSTPLAAHVRTLFKSVGGGDDYTIKLSNVNVDIAGLPTFNTTAINTAANYFLCDETIKVQSVNLSATTPPGSLATTNAYRIQPILNKYSFLNINSGFESAALTTGWTTAGTGTWSRTTTATEFYAGVAGAKLVCATQFGSIQSEIIPVKAGKAYFGNTLLNIISAVTVTFYIIPEIEFFETDGVTSLGVVTRTPDVSNSNMYNRRTDGWIIHQTGTGLVFAPAGAKFARIKFSLSGGVTAGSNVTATVCFDQMGLVEL